MDTSCYEQFLWNVNGVQTNSSFLGTDNAAGKPFVITFLAPTKLEIVVVMPHINVKYLFFERFCFVISLKEQ